MEKKPSKEPNSSRQAHSVIKDVQQPHSNRIILRANYALNLEATNSEVSLSIKFFSVV